MCIKGMYLGEGLIFCATQIDKLLEMLSKRRCSFDSQEELDKGKDTGGRVIIWNHT